MGIIENREQEWQQYVKIHSWYAFGGSAGGYDAQAKHQSIIYH
jgi:hypothetical protein